MLHRNLLASVAALAFAAGAAMPAMADVSIAYQGDFESLITPAIAAYEAAGGHNNAFGGSAYSGGASNGWGASPFHSAMATGGPSSVMTSTSSGYPSYMMGK